MVGRKTVEVEESSLKIYCLSCHTNIHGAESHFNTGAWKTKPTPEEIKEFIKVAFPGCYDDDTDSLLGEFYVLEFTVYSNVKTHLRKR